MATRAELLEHLWNNINLRERSLENIIENCERDPAGPFGDTGAAIERLLATGPSRRDLCLVLRATACQAVFGTLYSLSDPGAEEKGDVSLLYEGVGWRGARVPRMPFDRLQAQACLQTISVILNVGGQFRLCDGFRTPAYVTLARYGVAFGLARTYEADAERRPPNTHVRGSSMTAGSESRRAIVGAIVGLLYGFILTLLSMFAAGAGHGISIPLWLSSAPLGAFGLVAWQGANYAMLLSPPLVWAALGPLAALPKRLRLTRVLVLLQYASGLALVATTGGVFADLDVMWRDVWVTVHAVVWATVYLVGQVALWWRIMRHSQP